MKIICYKIKTTNTHQVGVLQGKLIQNLNSCFGNISIIDLIQIEDYQNKALNFISQKNCLTHKIEDVTVLPTIPRPNSFRDAYAFREHVQTCRENRGAKMIPEFDKFPVFYFSNHNAMFADGAEIELMPDHFDKLDYQPKLIINNLKELLEIV